MLQDIEANVLKLDAGRDGFAGIGLDFDSCTKGAVILRSDDGSLRIEARENEGLVALLLVQDDAYYVKLIEPGVVSAGAVLKDYIQGCGAGEGIEDDFGKVDDVIIFLYLRGLFADGDASNDVIFGVVDGIYGGLCFFKIGTGEIEEGADAARGIAVLENDGLLARAAALRGAVKHGGRRLPDGRTRGKRENDRECGEEEEQKPEHGARDRERA